MNLGHHAEVCERVPLADELYEFMFGEGLEMSMEEMAQKFNCSPPFLLDRVLAKYEDAAERIAARRNHLFLIGYDKLAERRPPELLCMCCGILLEEPDMFGLCDDCQTRLDAGDMPERWLRIIEMERKKRDDIRRLQNRIQERRAAEIRASSAGGGAGDKGRGPTTRTSADY
jgi:hypothetical protein